LTQAGLEGLPPEGRLKQWLRSAQAYAAAAGIGSRDSERVRSLSVGAV
jgi:hypothetical protein